MYVVYEMGVRTVLFHGVFKLEIEAIEYIRYHRGDSLTFEFVEIIST
mgnify:CR=1 FL=1